MNHRTAIAILVWSMGIGAHSAPLPLAAQKPIALPGKPGRFDFMAVDSIRNRLLAAHKATQRLAQLDLTDNRLLSEINTGTAQGLAVDEQGGTYYVGDETEHNVLAIEAATGKQVAAINVAGPVDAMVVNPKNHMLYAGHDEETEVWVIDTATKKMVGSIPIPGVPETIEYDSATDRLYQSLRSNETIQSKDEVAVIDPSTNKVVATWSTLPASSLFGLAIDHQDGHLFVGGANGKLVGIDLKTGKPFATADIGRDVEQITFDPGTKRIYCSTKEAISVVQATKTELRFLANIPTPKRSYGIAIAPRTGSVWIAFSNEAHSYFQEFKVVR